MNTEPLKIAVDCDGVLASFTDGFACVANRLYPGTFPNGYVQRTWNFEEMPELNLTKSKVNKVWREIRKNEVDFWLGLNPMIFEVNALHVFLTSEERKAKEIQVFYVTSRVPSAGMSVLRQTKRWLAKQLLWDRSCTCIVKPSGVTKAEIYRALDIRFSIDDHWENVPEPWILTCSDIVHTKGEGHRGFLLARPWNEGHREGLEIVETMQEYLKAVLEY